jgi:hypothetical protein
MRINRPDTQSRAAAPLATALAVFVPFARLWVKLADWDHRIGARPNIA